MTRLKAVVAIAALAGLLTAGLAQASYPKPPTGPWLSAPGSGFTLKKGQGAKRNVIYLSNFHVKPEAGSACAEASEGGSVKVLGSFPLKQFHRGGYTAWGVGKNVGGEPGYGTARVSAGGKTVDGGLYVTWNYENPSEVLRGGVQFGECTLEFFGAKPK